MSNNLNAAPADYDKIEVRLNLGALNKLIKEQLAEQGLEDRQVENHQEFARAISMLYIHNIITEAEAKRAKQRLMKEIVKSVQPR